MILFGSDIGIEAKTSAFGGFIDQIAKSLSKATGNFKLAAEKIFVDDGFENVAGTAFSGSNFSNIDDIKTRKITTQEPNITVYIKKKMFWSLRNEFDPRFMDQSEKLFVRASKILFENKCIQIAAYEAMTKISKLLGEESELDADKLDIIVNMLDDAFDITIAALNSVNGVSGNSIEINQAEQDAIQDILSNVKKDQEKVGLLADGLRKLSGKVKKTKQATNTNWVIDSDAASADVLGLGRGSGVIELTLVNSLSTSLSLESGNSGSIRFTAQDPYNLTKITSSELEMALSTANSELQDINLASSDVSQQDIATALNTSPSFFLDAAREKEEQLKKIRRDKVASFFGITSGSSGGLGTAAVPEIVFEVNPASAASSKVSIGITSSPAIYFDVNSFRLSLLSLPVDQQLGSTENQLVVEIYKLLTEYVEKVKQLNDKTLQNNADPDVEYARRKLRQFFLGKSIIQPMDGVHVYIRGNTFKDGQIVGPLNALLNNTDFFQSFVENSNTTDAFLEEEMRMFGIADVGIPVDLYRQLRTGSFLRNAGMHVFGGLVESVTSHYADGMYTLEVAGISTLKWLDMSRANTTPSLDQPQGVLEDPLTQYQFEIDPGTGLPKTRPKLLQQNLDRIKNEHLNFNSGSNKSEKVREDNTVQDFIDNGNGITTPVSQHAPGMVYRWKEGVMAVTRDINTRAPLDGTGSNDERIGSEVGVNVVENPFATSDAADVVSIMVTGFPHNYESFVLNSQSIGTYTFGGNNNSSESYFNSFFDIFRRNNRAHGNFQPFKTVGITSDQMKERLRVQTELTQTKSKLGKLRSELANLQDQLNTISTRPSELPSIEFLQKHKNSNAAKSAQIIEGQRSELSDRLAIKIDDIQKQIDTEMTNFYQSIGEGGAAEKAGLRIYGNDISFDIEKETAASTSDELEENNRKSKIKNKMLQLRPQLNCKFNYDTNLFIVSDDYDKDLDIRAYVLSSISNAPPLWESTYMTPHEICNTVAKTLDFEFYCDSQGHIQFRSPKYNKVPLSLLLRLFLLDRTENKKLYPVFLEQLFKNRAHTYKDEADIASIEILEYRILLGQNIGNEDLQNVINEKESVFSSASALTNVWDVSKNFSPDEIKDRASLLLKIRNLKASRSGGTPNAVNGETSAAAAQEISLYNSVNNIKNPNLNTQRLNIINKLAQLISKRQKIISILGNLGGEIEKFDGTVANISSFGGGNGRLTKNEMTKLTAPFEDLIENDLFDELGPGSASRFTIYDDQIISSNLTESDSEAYCRFDVTGSEDFISKGEGDIGGVKKIWAAATDFDMWRQYGFRPFSSINKPFLKDAELQCAPYALMLLSRVRRNIIKGNIVVVGNEYYQLGDVVYVNSNDMLYYVTNVSHNFSYDSSGSFTTELELRYGHPLGEYIPTPLDVIGKSLIKGYRNFNNRVTTRETSNKNTGAVIGTVKFPIGGSNISSNILKEMISGGLGKFNLPALKNALLKARAQISTAKFPKIEVRGFYVDEADKGKVESRMDIVVSWLANPISGLDLNGNAIPLSKKDYGILDSKDFNIVGAVNVKKLSEEDIIANRIPKEEAFSTSLDGDPTDAIDIVLIFE